MHGTYHSLVVLVVFLMACVYWLVKKHIREIVMLHSSIQKFTVQELRQSGNLRSGDLLLFEWYPAEESYTTFLLSCYTHVGLVYAAPNGQTYVVESHARLDRSEMWPGISDQTDGPHVHPLESRVASYPGRVFHVPMESGVRRVSGDDVTLNQKFRVFLDLCQHYPYYPEPIMNTLSAPVVFVCGALIHSITKVRHFFACGDFAMLTLVHLGLLGGNHRWWAVATPRCLLELRNDEGDRLFDATRMRRIVGHCGAKNVSQFKVQIH